MTSEELIESLDRHFLAGNASPIPSQLREHQDRGSCQSCDEIARFAAMSLRREPAAAGPSFGSSI